MANENVGMALSEVHYLHLPSHRPLPPLTTQPFRAVVVIEQAVSDDWRLEVSRWLVRSGCRYMMAWGPDCSLWDDDVDWANQEQFGDEEIPDDRFIWTTWHDDETLFDVFWYAEACAHDPYIELGLTLILHIASPEQRAELLEAYAQAQGDWLPDD